MQCLSRLPERVREALFGRHTPGKHNRAHVAPLVRAAHALAMVRPYLVAHKRRQERQRHPQRMRALVLATVGVDFLPEVPR